MVSKQKKNILLKVLKRHGRLPRNKFLREIEKLNKVPGIKENWFLGNSTHVVDLAFYLGGKPKQISTIS